MYRIGVDVGGTNTDGVILDIRKSSDPQTRGVVAFYKHATTVNVTGGIEVAVKNVLDQAGVDPASGQVLSLTIGTTHFINAVVQSDTRRLSKVAVIRLAAPYTAECPSFIDFPPNLKKIMNGHTAIVSGGHQIDGRLINPVLESELVEQATQIRAKGLKDIVLVGVFSPLDVSGDAEYAARDIFRREFGPRVNIVCSRDVGQIGLLERENASILNASITSFAQRTIRGFENAMTRLGLVCPLYITQNDGTLTTAAEAARLPVKTFSSGATNSMRGASYLAGIDLKKKDGTGKSMLVADVGGTTTDVGVLLPSGFPRQAAAFIEVGGVRTNFAMPDVNSIGLGGGSRIRVDGSKVAVGPDSVGHYLTRDSRVFSGDILTATDISVRGGVNGIGDSSQVADVSDEVLEKAGRVIKRLVENVVDQMKTSPEDCSLLLVGGGSIIIPPQLDGVKEILIPPFHSVANAVGAAIANISGEIDTIEILQGKSLDDTLSRIKKEAIAKAVEGGADESSARIAEINILPVQYVTNQATRIIIRAVGEIGVRESGSTTSFRFERSQEQVVEETETVQQVLEEGADGGNVKIDYDAYRPKIIDDEWHLTETDLFFIMEGCGILGTGGGGSPYPTFLMCRQVLLDGRSIRIIDHTSIPDDGYIVRGEEMGSPSVSNERIMGGAPIMAAGKELAGFLGGKKLWATVCDEIGGGNGMKSLLTAPLYGIPALDGDLMGRAYPLLHQVLPAVKNRPNALYPCSLCDGDGNIIILSKVKNDFYVESLMRTVTTEMGSSAAFCTPPLALKDARDFGVPRCLSQAWRLGRAVAVCRQRNDLKGIPNEILKLQTGACLFVGKIIGVTREVRAGFTWGEVRIARLLDDELEHAPSNTDVSRAAEEDKDDIMIIPFQNENLVAYIEKPDGSRRVAAIVPDLITILDSQSGSHLGTQMYMYGLRVTVIALAGSPLWTTEEGLKIGGPTAFGIDEPYVSIGEYKTPRSVIEEYR
ncbi:hydantoinase/oxoprolinase [Dendrothele bispora CBS 962.96]|uniref:Hydantoinase/oxoprolinase n=1 Tax=Dendrothele bispora (strain CBS 962.96) TaxID=1314807 RepID=A0A4S8LCG8_DENBC|nr:hydantoinase/oxoprolinase [Dendrothele bispora CBS 962.96]